MMPGANLTDAIIATVIVIYLAYTSVVGARDYKAVAAATGVGQRLRFFRKWGAELVALTIGGFVGLLISGRLADLSVFPSVLAPLHAFLGMPAAAFVLWLCVAGFCALLMFSTLSVARLAPNEANAARAHKVFASAPLIARNERERAWGILMSVCAGVGEEIVFRLLFPVVLFALTHNIVIAVLTPLAAFGIGHAYQGMGGVISTAIVGAMMFGVYAATQSLWIAIAFHACVDVRAVVLLGWLLDRLARAGPAAPSDASLEAPA